MLGRKFKKVQGFLSARFGKKNNERALKAENDSDDSNYSPVLNVYISVKQPPIARIVLNGYNIEEGMLNSLGAMHSFKVVQGDLWDQWDQQTAVTLSDDNGRDALRPYLKRQYANCVIKVMCLPMLSKPCAP